jgi:hypothetical protein
MSACPHCYKELPPLTDADLKLMFEALKQNKELMLKLGQEAAKTYLSSSGSVR